MDKRAGTPRGLSLCPTMSDSCMELLASHYRSRIAMIDQLVDEIARLGGDQPKRKSGRRSGSGVSGRLRLV
jgi:hypothetical protein